MRFATFLRFVGPSAALMLLLLALLLMVVTPATVTAACEFTALVVDGEHAKTNRHAGV